MRDSNQLHAVCLDTFPPCVYMNATSHAVVDLVHAINDAAGKFIVRSPFLKFCRSRFPDAIFCEKFIARNSISKFQYISFPDVICDLALPKN